MAANSEATRIDEASMSDLARSILEDCLYNIVSDTVMKIHRDEKIIRMQSAAIVAQAAQEKAKSEEDASFGEAFQSITTAGASATEDGKIYLHGNPFYTTPEVLCPTCRKPRLLYPTTGKNSQPPEPGKDYCAKKPYVQKDGCDIYGRSLQLKEPPRNKKSGKDSKTKDPSPDNSEKSDGSHDNGKASEKLSVATIPSGKCPNCTRYMALNRIAAHLERCMALGGRQSSKNAMIKISSQGTPRESRASTPKPAATKTVKKRKLEKGSDDETEEAIPQKKKKKSVIKKMVDTGPKSKALNTNIQRVKSADKRLPGQSDRESREPSPLAKIKEKENKKEIKKEIKKEKSPEKPVGKEIPNGKETTKEKEAKEEADSPGKSSSLDDDS
ncbi:hypothetical protein MMC26_004176 [Xylographa opegraphella]|nr:hypothetical protein [Xylographa opegraphella]